MIDLTVGTAGHIDHGKTTLVKALTGVDGDRLPEEKQRGITIDLGFAELELGDLHVGFIDVPGHERFVKNMLAGVSGIDLVMLIVAADEGVMPQTREHFDICRLLGIKAGFVVLTKSDLVDAETMELARLDVAELVKGSFLESAAVIEVSSLDLAGLESVRELLKESSRHISPKPNYFSTRLPIDRSFTVKGFGAVVTGTLAAGEIRDADELQLLPDGRRIRVRGLQTHGRKVASVHSGQRVAVNLAGIDHSIIARGMQVCEPDVFRPSQIIDTEVEVLETAKRPLRTRQRIRLHIGTIEALARVTVLNNAGEIAQGEAGSVQLRLEQSIVCVPDERFIIRQYSPQETIAGGRILDPLAEKHRRKDQAAVNKYLADLAKYENGTVGQIAVFIDHSGKAGIDLADLRARTGLDESFLRKLLVELVVAGTVIDAAGRFLSATAYLEITENATAELELFHKSEPLARGMPLDVMRERAFAYIPPTIARAVVDQLVHDGKAIVSADIVRLASHRTELSGPEQRTSESISEIYRLAGLDVPRLDDVLAVASEEGSSPEVVRKLFNMKVDAGEIVKVTDEFYFAASVIDSLVAKLRDQAAATGNSLIDVAQFKQIAGVSRKYAIPLLEYFDRTRVTRRAADKRIIL